MGECVSVQDKKRTLETSTNSSDDKVYENCDITVPKNNSSINRDNSSSMIPYIFNGGFGGIYSYPN